SLTLLVSLCDHEHPLRLSGSVREHGGTADHLIGVLGIDSEKHRQLDRLIELGEGDLLEQTERLIQLIRPLFDFLERCTVLLAVSSQFHLRSVSGSREPPTVCSGCTPEPFGIPAALSSRMAAGGVLVMNVNVRSEKTVMTTGMISPCCPCVRALNVLQNSMMFTPCWPRAGPTGGAGVAAPAGIWSLMYPVIFLAIVNPCAFRSAFFYLSLLSAAGLLLFCGVVSGYLEGVE